MTSLVCYVVRQRRGWSVEEGGIVRSGHLKLEDAIQDARSRLASACKKGGEWRLRIQQEAGGWREERSFAPAGEPAQT